MVGALAVSLVSLIQVGQPVALGKSGPEILAMGFDRFFEQYTREVGESTMDMVEAHTIYIDLLRSETRGRLASLPAGERDTITQAGEAMLELLPANWMVHAAGGGSMFNIFMASAALEAAQIESELVEPKPTVTPSRAGAERQRARAKARLEQTARAVETYKEAAERARLESALDMSDTKEREEPFEVGAARRAQEAYDEMRKAFAKLEGLAPKLSVPRRFVMWNRLAGAIEPSFDG